MHEFDITCSNCNVRYQGEVRGIDKPVTISMYCVCDNHLAYTTVERIVKWKKFHEGYPTHEEKTDRATRRRNDDISNAILDAIGSPKLSPDIHDLY